MHSVRSSVPQHIIVRLCCKKKHSQSRSVSIFHGEIAKNETKFDKIKCNKFAKRKLIRIRYLMQSKRSANKCDIALK